MDDFETGKLFEKKMLSIFRSLGTNEYCRVYKKCGEQDTIKIKSVDQTRIEAIDKKGTIFTLMISDIEKVETIKNIEDIRGYKK